jgi:hypothetical protein
LLIASETALAIPLSKESEEKFKRTAKVVFGLFITVNFPKEQGRSKFLLPRCYRGKDK